MARAGARRKNFTYGDLWQSAAALPSRGKGRKKTAPEKYTRNSAFLAYLKKNNYSLYLDHDYPGYAHTDVTHKEIVINGNLTDMAVEVALQHELGHLMLFDVNQFVTVGRQTLRSVVAKILYTPSHLIKYGIEQLLYTENIIQDIVIETTSNGNCFCHRHFSDYGSNAGVKHLSQLESVGLIAEEVCKNVLVPKEKYAPPPPNPAMKELLEAMLGDLGKDMGEIRKKLRDEQQSRRFLDEQQNRRARKVEKRRGELEKIKARQKRGSASDQLKTLKKRIEKELEELTSPEGEMEDFRAAAKSQQNTVAGLEKKLQNRQELKDKLKEQLQEEESSEPDADSAEGGGEGNGTSGEGNPSHCPVSPNIDRNLTDHLSEDDTSTGGHSYDCGFPHPIQVSRSESHENENNLLSLDTAVRVKKIVVSDDDSTDFQARNRKSSLNETTYFKASKKEFAPSDMLQGKRRLRVAGINVLVGLDVSGSMTKEWGAMFVELAQMVRELKEKLDIENIVYFTYNHALKEHSNVLEELTIQAGGGNAFGHVYQQLMLALPIKHYNEIILVTDCGDNLGFDLSSVAEVERNGAPVHNHISIIDTEGAGFYQKTDFHEEQWSLHRHTDKDVHLALKRNIERLIEMA